MDNNLEKIKLLSLKKYEVMNYIAKKSFEKTVKEFLTGLNNKKRLEVMDLRYLCEQGIPALQIMVHNIPIECFEKGVEKWLNGLGT